MRCTSLCEIKEKRTFVKRKIEDAIKVPSEISQSTITRLCYTYIRTKNNSDNNPSTRSCKVQHPGVNYSHWIQR